MKTIDELDDPDDPLNKAYPVRGRQHWAAKYIGIPYEEGARGPNAYDCWGIIQLIYLNEKGIRLPELPGLSAPQMQEIHDTIMRESVRDWTEIAEPVEGCIVAMGGRTGMMHHVGVYINADGGKVLHSRLGLNAVAETLRGLKLRGLRIIKLYQHSQWLG